MNEQETQGYLDLLRPIIASARSVSIDRGSIEEGEDDLGNRRYVPGDGYTITINGGATHPPSFLAQRRANADAS